MALKTKIPILEITKVKSPKVAVNKDTLSPPAKIAGSGFPIASTESKAVIKPITDPKNPKTSPKRLLSTARKSILLESSLFVLSLINPLMIKKRDNKKQIRMSDIKKVPPSINLSTKGFETTTNFGNNTKDTCITVRFLINILQT